MFTNMKTTACKILILSVAFTLLFSFWTGSLVNASTIDPNTKAELELSKELSKAKILLDDEITITYKVKAKPIPASVVKQPKRDIYLVLDTSGSMNFNLEGQNLPGWSMEKRRIDIAREAAFKFLDKMKDKSGVSVGLISYSDVAAEKQGLTSNLNVVKNRINSLNIIGGTNIGDGLRLGYYRLTKSPNRDAEKYLILLTDGEPTYHSVHKPYNYWKYYFLDDGNAPDFLGGGNYAWPQDIEYCNVIAEQYLRPSVIKSYMIAFTKGSNANVLNQIAQKAGGVYKRAEDSGALDQVYEEIYEDIFVEFSVENVKFEETFPEGLEIVSVPEGFTVDGQTVTGNLSNINYLYNASSNKYEAEPIEFIIKIKGANAGEYSLDSGKLSYKDIDGRNESRNFSEKPFEVVALQALIKVDRGLEEEEIFINKEVDISYTIIPEEFGIDPELEPPSELMVKSVNFSEEFPEGLTIVSASNGLSVTDRKVSGNLGNIIYHYDSKDGKYKAKPVTFNIKLCRDEEGEYTLGKLIHPKSAMRIWTRKQEGRVLPNFTSELSGMAPQNLKL